MKKVFLSFIVFFAVTVIKAQDVIVVDSNASLRTMNGSFNGIKISGGIDLYLSQSSEQAVAVSAAEEKFKNGIKTILENGILKIYYDGDKSIKLKNRKLRAYVSLNSLEKLDASGACDIVVADSITGESFDMQLSGVCDFTGIVKVNTLKLDLGGYSDVRISGTAKTANIESSGNSDVKGYGLVTDYCNVKASGASDINITVNKELNANALGASNIYFKGDATIKEKQSNGSSTIARQD